MITEEKTRQTSHLSGVNSEKNIGDINCHSVAVPGTSQKLMALQQSQILVFDGSVSVRSLF